MTILLSISFSLSISREHVYSQNKSATFKTYQYVFQDLPELETVGRVEVELAVQPADGVDLRCGEVHAVLDEVLAGPLENRL